MNDGTNVKMSIWCTDRYGWNIYANKANLHILEDVIKNYIKGVIENVNYKRRLPEVLHGMIGELSAEKKTRK